MYYLYKAVKLVLLTGALCVIHGFSRAPLCFCRGLDPSDPQTPLPPTHTC